uniref:Uncharacterized protein n=1 Tax=Mimiviridae sp. ChoanoV1 TaxID=2596887 RepID=A0A5B8IJ37_9VIRU|nr:hypothetical protein 6_64 [Mimiviridae sp. ChoanoV1]
MVHLLKYSISGIIGATLFILIYHFSLKKNSGLCALPFMGLFGLYTIYNNKGSVNKYLLKIVMFYSLYIFLFYGIYLLYKKTNKLNLSVGALLLLWFIMICYNIF